MILVREEEREIAERKKKRLFALYVIIACLFVTAALLLLFLSPDGYKPYMIVTIVLSIVFGCYSVFFFTVQYDLAVKRYRLLNKVFSALTEREYGVFQGEADEVTYEGVEMRTLRFKIIGTDRDVHLLQGDVTFVPGGKYLLEIHAGVLVEAEDANEEAFC